MNGFRISPAARTDLDDIWFYIAQDNVEAADKFIHAIVSRFPKLAVMPELDAGVKSYHHDCEVFVGRYIIFYRPMKAGIEIARVLHGARDYPPLFE